MGSAPSIAHEFFEGEEEDLGVGHGAVLEGVFAFAGEPGGVFVFEGKGPGAEFEAIRYMCNLLDRFSPLLLLRINT